MDRGKGAERGGWQEVGVPAERQSNSNGDGQPEKVV